MPAATRENTPAPADPGAPPWARRPGEGAAEYEQFLAYRDLPPRERNATAAYYAYVARRDGPEAAAARREKDRKLDKRPSGYVRTVARKNGWAARARAWDARFDDAAADARAAVLARQARADAVRVVRERREWNALVKEQARRLLRQGSLLASFPPRDEHRETPDGPVVIKAANARQIMAGAKLIEAAHRLMSDVTLGELGAAVPDAAAVAPADLPTPDEMRASDFARLESAAIWLNEAARAGDREALGGMIRVLERRAKLFGLDAPPAAPTAAPAGAGRPAVYRVVKAIDVETVGAETTGGVPDEPDPAGRGAD